MPSPAYGGGSTLSDARRRADCIHSLSCLLAKELEDLDRPHCKRYSSDVYQGPDGDVSQQFLADAARSQYHIAGLSYRFQPKGEEASSAFAERLAGTVRRCLGVEGDEAQRRTALMRFATLLLSQAGLALVGLACPGPQIAPSGGTRSITYELARVGTDDDGTGWELQARFRAEGFTEYMEATELADMPRSCSPESCIERGCVVHLRLDERAPAGIKVRVQNIVDSVTLFDDMGLIIEFPQAVVEDRSLTKSGLLVFASWFSCCTSRDKGEYPSLGPLQLVQMRT